MRGWRIGWYDSAVERDTILAFARRDWARVADAKDAFWLERKRSRPAEEILAVGDQLRLHARTMRPDWPTEAERAADLAVHRRVAEALHAAGRRTR